MPLSSPNLRSLRIRSGVKPGAFAEMVGAARSHYSNMEHGRVVGSPELFGRCATVLTRLLSERVEVDDLMAATSSEPDEEDEHEHTDAGTGPPNRGDSTGPGRLHPSGQARGAA